jgi:hypothetical protein
MLCVRSLVLYAAGHRTLIPLSLMEWKYTFHENQSPRFSRGPMLLAYSIAGYSPMEWPSVALLLSTCNGLFSLALIIKAVIEKGPQGSLTRQFQAENGEGHFAAAGAAAIPHSSCVGIEGNIF